MLPLQRRAFELFQRVSHPSNMDNSGNNFSLLEPKTLELWKEKIGRAGPAVWGRERKVERYLSALFWSRSGTRPAASRLSFGSCPRHKPMRRGNGSSSCSPLRGSPNSHHLQPTVSPQALSQQVAHPHLLSHGRNTEATEVSPGLQKPV